MRGAVFVGGRRFRRVARKIRNLMQISPATDSFPILFKPELVPMQGGTSTFCDHVVKGKGSFLD
jgi:hypothetical protein